VWSELGGLPLGHVLGGRRREELRSELGGLSHVSLNLHLALHKSHLRVELSKADLVEVGVSHGEDGVGRCRLTLLDGTLSVLEIDLIDNLNLASLGLGDLKCVDSVYLPNEILAVALSEVGEHHAEDIISLETVSSNLRFHVHIEYVVL
jgi:hypothetical protein